jgi:hypothetical protein
VRRHPLPGPRPPHPRPPPPKQDLSAAPAPAAATPVRLAARPGGTFAAAVFNGVATPRRCKEVEGALRAALARDGLQPVGAVTLARYNDPGVKPERRRNEILLELTPGSFDLWR